MARECGSCLHHKNAPAIVWGFIKCINKESRHYKTERYYDRSCEFWEGK
jgi:hypothetical protein